MVWEVNDIGSKPAESKGNKAKKNGKKQKREISADEEAWSKLSLEAPPPLPQAFDSTATGTKKRKRTKHNVETIHDLQWSEVQNPSSLLLTDDAGGFVCLEELSDVDVEYEGDDATGKIIKFKVWYQQTTQISRSEFLYGILESVIESNAKQKSEIQQNR
jgi:hypothetical protein